MAQSSSSGNLKDQEDLDPNVKRLAQTITCHAWNKERTLVALCPNSNVIEIYDTVEWELKFSLVEHDQVVTGLDWAHNSNRLVSCGQDRNAYVWRFEGNSWKPTLVILRINRAATFVKWSPNEEKFAVSSGAKVVSICYFEKDNDWWVSKHIKKHDSTVTRVDWHPGSILVATSSTDSKVRILSSFIRGLDKKPGDTPYGARLPFGELLGEYDSSTWIHSVRWSPSGNQLAFASHDSSVTFIDVSNGSENFEFQIVRSNGLPYVDLQWANESAVVAAGHNCYPQLFEKKGATWEITRNIDEQKGEKKAAGGAASAARQMFQNKVDKGEDKSVGTVLQTKHQALINSIQPFKGTQGNYTGFTTTGLDGKLCIWTL